MNRVLITLLLLPFCSAVSAAGPEDRHVTLECTYAYEVYDKGDKLISVSDQKFSKRVKLESRFDNGNYEVFKILAYRAVASVKLGDQPDSTVDMILTLHDIKNNRPVVYSTSRLTDLREGQRISSGLVNLDRDNLEMICSFKN